MPTFREARDCLLAHRTDLDRAVAAFSWPDPVPFNWALDWFDADLAVEARDRPALRIVEAGSGAEQAFTFGEMWTRSNQVANHPARPSDCGAAIISSFLLGNVPALWETMLAAMKLGAVVIPATTLLTADELADRLARGAGQSDHRRPRAVGTLRGGGHAGRDPPRHGSRRGRLGCLRRGLHGVGKLHAGRAHGRRRTRCSCISPPAPRRSRSSCATSHRSYPAGALSTMYWLGLQPGDVHCNVSSPGWAKHAWSSFFAPWNAGATILVINQAPFSASALLAQLERTRATTLCAPPTVWRMIIQEDLSGRDLALREVCAAGEPLNPEVIERVKSAWGPHHPRRLRPDRDDGR